MREYSTDRFDAWAETREYGYFAGRAMDALETLSPLEARVINARLWEKLTWDQMAIRFHMSRSSIQRLFNRAVEKLGNEVRDAD